MRQAEVERLRSVRARVAGWKDLSLVDVLGEPSFTIWFNYCNFRCPWCQNGHVVSGEVSREVEVGELADLAAASYPLVKFVHVTGGEPTLQDEALEALFKLCKLSEMKTSLSTNGSRPGVVRRLTDEGLLDHMALDVKGPLNDPERYGRIAGLSIALAREIVPRIRETLRLALGNLSFVEIRTTLVPGLVEEREVMEVVGELREEVSQAGGSRVAYVLQQFSPSETAIDPRFRRGKRSEVDRLLELGRLVKSKLSFEEVYIRCVELGTVRVN